MTCFRRLLLSAIATLAVVGSALAADAPVVPKPSTPAVVAANPDLQKLVQQFNTHRDSILANREAMLKQLMNATAEQKKEILNKMAEDQKDLIDAQRALAKQIRDEMRKLRQNLPAGPGH